MTQVDCIRVLHISDLHFGEKCRFKEYIDKGECSKLGERLAVPVLEHGRPDIVAVTGDIAHTGAKNEYQHALAFLTGLAQKLELAPNRFVLCPGNHDVNWNRCKSVELIKDDEGWDEKRYRAELEKVKYIHYDWLLSEFYKTCGIPALSIDDRSLIYNFDDYRLSVAALNSAIQESHNEVDHKGELGEKQISALRDYWQQENYQNWIKIICLHHNPSPSPEDVQRLLESYKAKNDIEVNEKFLKQYLSTVLGIEDKPTFKTVCGTIGVQLILSGHTHYEDGDPWNWRKDGRTELLSVGSFGLAVDALPPEQPNQVQLLELDFKEFKYVCKTMNYDPKGRHPDGYSLKYYPGDEKSNYLSPPPNFDLHDRTAEPASKPSDKVSEIAPTDFLGAFRRCFKSAYQKWDLSLVGVGIPPSHAGPRPEADLDEMFLPLRLGEGIDREDYNNGEKISPEKLLERGTKPLSIRGQAGSGKTTWMKWTFRRLVEMENTLPAMIALRDLAKFQEERKSTLTGAGLSLPGYLAHWLGKRVGDIEQEKTFLNILKKPPTGLRPVLLVDGWDELGSQGNDFRELLLSFMNSHPHVLVVTSSRPQSESPPDFETLDIQPLSRDEITDLAENFFKFYYESDREQIEKRLRDFNEQLDASPEALNLSRTALLLSMLLIVSLNSTLPDKRHELYEKCLETMLIIAPRYREKKGEQEHIKCWRPEDSDARWQAVTGLARQMKDREKEQGDSSNPKLIIMEKKSVIPFLSPDWTKEQKEFFVNWLVFRAAVLVEPEDGSYSFVHLSFQEYLAARDLNSKKEGQDRIDAFKELCKKSSWWETLRLWAALVASKNPAFLEEVQEELSKDKENGFWLVGAMLADGLGQTGRFEKWAQGFVLAQHWLAGSSADYSARSWANSGQKERRLKLAGLLPKIAADLTWLTWLHLDDWQKRAGLDLNGSLPRPDEPASGWTIAALETTVPTEPLVAFGRVWAHGNPLWPAPMDWELAGLRLWPGPRLFDSLRLQIFAGFGANSGDVSSWARVALQPTSPPNMAEIENILKTLDVFPRILSHMVSSDFSSDFLRDFSREISWYLSRKLSHDLSRGTIRYTSDSFSFDFSCDFSRKLSRNFSRDFSCSKPSRVSRSHSRKSSCLVLEGHLRKTSMAGLQDHWPAFKSLITYIKETELTIYVPCGTRAYIVSIIKDDLDSLGCILNVSCRLSLDNNPDQAALNQALGNLEEKYNHPLWPALARHISRLSDQADRELLEFAAKDPDGYIDQYAPGNNILRWGLKYYVRGDVMLADGSVLTLDELNREFGYDIPPYLEEMGEEIDLDELELEEE